MKEVSENKTCSPFAALRKFANQRPPLELCELCENEIADEHPHLIEPPTRQIVCSCRPCMFLFDNPGDTRYKVIPDRARYLENFNLSDVTWGGLMIPIWLILCSTAKNDVTILVDATPRGGEIGTLYTIEPDLAELDENLEEQAALDPHGMNPLKVLAMVKSMGGEIKRILLVGCEPEMLRENEEKMGMNEPVIAAVGKAVKIIEKLIEKILNENRQTAVV